MLTRRELLKALGLAPLAAVAAKLGIEATEPESIGLGRGSLGSRGSGYDMPVYTDGAHLVSDVLERLIDFAAEIGLPDSRFFDGDRPHYALAGHERQALNAGAIETTEANCWAIAEVAALRREIMERDCPECGKEGQDGSR